MFLHKKKNSRLSAPAHAAALRGGSQTPPRGVIVRGRRSSPRLNFLCALPNSIAQLERVAFAVHDDVEGIYNGQALARKRKSLG